MAGLRDTIIGIKAVGKDIKRDLLFEGERLFLLESTPNSSIYTLLMEVEAGWLVTWNEFRAQMVAKISTVDPTFRDLLERVSYFAYGVPVNDELDVYEINPDQRDITEPSANNSDWKIYGTRTGASRFIVPTSVAFSVTDCAVVLFEGDYVEMGTHNSKPYYTLDGAAGDPWTDDAIGFYWSGTAWSLATPYDSGLGTQGTQYYSNEDAATPVDVVTWTVLDAGALPLTIA